VCLFPIVRLAWIGLKKWSRFGAEGSVFCLTEKR
jgi:hypothetical protein